MSVGSPHPRFSDPRPIRGHPGACLIKGSCTATHVPITIPMPDEDHPQTCLRRMAPGIEPQLLDRKPRWLQTYDSRFPSPGTKARELPRLYPGTTFLSSGLRGVALHL